MNSNVNEPTQSIMPVLFMGHGNPMNAIEKNEFSDKWSSLGETLPKPTSIICISAHWETNGTAVTAMPQPKTIHDFGGFPKALYEVQYPAPGDMELANKIIRNVSKVKISADLNWGLDHGCWSVIRSMYPLADIPIVQLSLDRNQPASYHYQLAKELQFLREKGVLIIGSGNIVHNLRQVEWQNKGGAEWAQTANDTLKKLILNDEHNALIDYQKLGKEVQMAIPTPEHYLPLLYILALKQKEEAITLFNDSLVMGSLSMTSLMIA
jgi:4,5-DOPA dioxygenase extradiol